MAKGYWIAQVTVTDPERYKVYAEQAGVAFRKFGATILARGGAYHGVEGEARPRNVVIEFASLADAKACYDSPEYQAAREHRIGAGIASIVLVEGVAG